MDAKRLPLQVKEALVAVCGKAFWLKQPLINTLLDAGVPEDVVHQYEEESKYKMARLVLAELERRGNEGYLIQKRLLTNLCNLRNLVDDTVPNRAAGLDALRSLKSIALEENLVRKRNIESDAAKRRDRESRTKEISLRAAKLEKLHKDFLTLATSTGPQARGYDLESLLEELFALNEIKYHKSYKTPTGQIDGHFYFRGFDYLVEARWRKDQPTVAEIGGFKVKVDQSIASTRGLFIAIQGIRDEVVKQFSGEGAKLIFVDGGDLMCILEQRIPLRDALDLKIEKAAQQGTVFFPLYKT